MPAIRSNPHYTTYDIENMLRNAGFSPATSLEGRPQPGYFVWRQYEPGREKRKKGGVLRVRAENCEPGTGGRKNLEKYFVEALRGQGVWVQVRGANIIIPQEARYLPGTKEATLYKDPTRARRRTSKKGA